jgi:UDP-glucose 4-epimerase
MKKVLITGGKGYVGSKLKIALEEAGNEVTVFDLPQNILNVEELKEAIKGIDIVFHLAAIAEISYTTAHPQETYEINIEGTNNVARICAEEGAVLNFVSTACSYGEPLEIPSVEDQLVNPTDVYAMSKMAGEYIVKLWGLSSDLKYNILKWGTIYGPSTEIDMRGDMCIQKFMEAAVKKQPIEITGNGRQNRCFIQIDDLINALVLLIGKDIIGETINLTGNESISINDIADYALEFGAIEKTYVAEREGDFMNQDTSIEKAKELLGWEPQIKFKDGIRDFYNYVKDNQND